MLSSISTLISKILLDHYAIDSHLVIQNEKNNLYILSKTGIFTQISLTNDVLTNLRANISHFYFQNNVFSKFPLKQDSNLLGWLIIDNRANSKLTLTEHETLKTLSFSIGEIINNIEYLYNVKQETLHIDNIVCDDYIHYKYINMVQNFHKNFSIFIHDHILQDFLALKKLTESLATKQIDTKNMILNSYDSLNKVFRNKIFELYPTILKEASLQQCIKILCIQYNNTQKNSTIKFNYSLDIQIQAELKFHLYRIIQELLVNALKHSKAKKISIFLGQINSNIEIIVQDNGIGFNFEEIKHNKFSSKHFGLLSIHQEITSLNGEINISKTNPTGTKIIVTIPITKKKG